MLLKLVTSESDFLSNQHSQDAKDVKIAELTMDLGREEQLRGQYHELATAYIAE